MRVLSAGMGRQCSAILALVEAGAIAPYDLIVFADTQTEPPAVYDNVAYWRARGHDIRVVTAGDLSERMDVIPLYVRGKSKARQCTRDYKVMPVRDAILDYLVSADLASINAAGRRRVRPGVKVQQHIGFSSSELYRVARKSYNPSWLVNAYPLIDLGMTTADCIRLLRAGGHPVVRSACLFCPFTSDERYKGMPPSERAAVVAYDERLRSTEFLSLHPKLAGASIHRTGRPMADVFARLDALPVQRALTGFADEALEGCHSDGANCMT